MSMPANIISAAKTLMEKNYVLKIFGSITAQNTGNSFFYPFLFYGNHAWIDSPYSMLNASFQQAALAAKGNVDDIITIMSADTTQLFNYASAQFIMWQPTDVCVVAYQGNGWNCNVEIAQPSASMTVA